MSHGFLIGALALLGAACTSPATTQARPPAGQEDPKAPVAKINGEAVTAPELDAFVKKDQRLYEMRKAGLDSLIAKRLVEAKAKAAGKTPEDLIKAEVMGKMPEPAEGELRALYERAKAGGQQLPPFDQVKPQIAQYVQQQKAQEALRAYYDKLRAEAKVELLLPAPRVEVAAEGPSRGPEKAPITIVEFSDFQCPYCGRAESTVNQVLAAYGDKVRLVFRDFPLPNHPDAPKAAEAAHCAGDQGKYWEMHGKLFANQQALEIKSLKGYAKEVGLDQGKFDKCLDAGEKAKLVESNRKAGEDAGVSGTPAFFVNGVMISGAQPLESFKAVIDGELARR
jgi:protein-disulfide isomerase